MTFGEIPYQRIELNEMKQKMAALKERFQAATCGEEQFEVHKDMYVLKDHVMTERILSEIRNSVNTKDEFYDAEETYYNAFEPEFALELKEYGELMLESPYRDYLEEKIGPVAFTNLELDKKAFSDDTKELRKEENDLSLSYDKLIASAAIPFEGEVYNLSLLRPHLTDVSREHRRKALKAMEGYFDGVTAEIDDIYDRMVKNRTQQARIMGYEDYRELGYYRMRRNSYDRDMVSRFRDEVKKHFVPLSCEIHEKRRERIGVDELRIYDNDVFFAGGNPAPVGDPAKILNAGAQMYKDLSPETGEFFDFMMKNELFDVLGRKNKRAGGYMEFLPDYKYPFIFANFNGTSSDVDVITHECGHAFQGYLTRNEEIREANDLTMETAEIHSMSMEYFTYGWMDRFFGERASEYLQMHLEDSIIFLPYGCMVDEFQHIVYEKPDMTPKQRKDTWLQLEEVYRPWLKYDGEGFFAEGGFWQKQGHIFHSPFYYIDYVLASVCAMQFKIKMDSDFEGTWKDYLKLCRLSVKRPYEEELRECGLRSPFDEGCIRQIAESIYGRK